MAQRTPTQVKQQRSYQDYLKQLDDLLKLNTGRGLFAATDTSSNTPIYVPGQVRNPSGIEGNAQAISSMQERQSVIPEFQPPQYEEIPQEGEVLGAQDDQGNMTVQDFVEQFTQAVYRPQSASSEELDQIYQQTGQKYAVQSLPDGRVRFNDGSIGIQEENPQPIASMSDGSILWSDGFTRQAPPREMVGQFAGTEGLSKFLFDGENQTITQKYGNVNKVEPTPGNVNVGTDFRTRDLQNRELKLPVNTRVLQVLRDDGTRFGDISGHDGYGNSVLLELPSGERVRLSHLSNLPQFEPGQEIPAGTIIGTPGTTGNTYGEHLDVEYYNAQGEIADPRGFLQTGAAQYSQSSPVTGISPYIKNNQMMSVDPRSTLAQSPSVETSTMQTGAIQSPSTQAASSYNNPNYNIDYSNSSASQGQSGYGIGAGVKQFAQDVKQLPQKAAQTIEKVNPTGEFDLGITEGGFNPEAQQARQQTALKFAQPQENRGFLGKARQSLGNATEFFGDTLGLPEGNISEIIAGGKTPRTNVAFAAELDQNAQDNEQPGQSLNIRQGVQNIFKQAKDTTGNALAQAGQGIKGLSSKVTDNIFRPDLPEEKRAVGTETASNFEADRATKTAQLADTAATASMRPDNDIRDKFFKFGGADTFSQYLNPGIDKNYKGALTLNLFKDDFYGDLSNISSVFGGSKDLGAATEKYVQKERAKYPTASRMNYEEGYDRGEIDNYNREIDKYNTSLESYFSSIPKSVEGFQSVYAPFNKPTLSTSRSNNPAISARPAAPQMSVTPRMSMAKPSAPQMSLAKPQMSVAPRPQASAPSMSAPPQQSNRPGSSAPQMSVAPRQAPRPNPVPALQSIGGQSKANGQIQGGMSVAPKKTAPANKNTGTNIFKQATNKILNIFRR